MLSLDQNLIFLLTPLSPLFSSQKVWFGFNIESNVGRRQIFDPKENLSPSLAAAFTWFSPIYLFLPVSPYNDNDNGGGGCGSSSPLAEAETLQLPQPFPTQHALQVFFLFSSQILNFCPKKMQNPSTKEGSLISLENTTSLLGRFGWLLQKRQCTMTQKYSRCSPLLLLVRKRKCGKWVQEMHLLCTATL